jgi:predicted phage terminase large subunit-like protein
MQRWHDDDPAARIVFSNPKRWSEPQGFIVKLPAIAEEDDQIGRQPGEPLWPEMWPLHVLEEIRENNEFWFAAQFQQRPVPQGRRHVQGDLVHRQRGPLSPPGGQPGPILGPRGLRRQGDWTVGVLMAKKGENYYVEDVVRGQWASAERDTWIAATAKEDHARYPNGVTIWVEEESGSSGKYQTQGISRRLDGFAINAERSTGSKVIRANSFASACGRGDVRMFKADWNDAFVLEMSTFPFGKKDDQVDASSGAYNKLALSEGDREGAWYDPSFDDALSAYGEVTF